MSTQQMLDEIQGLIDDNIDSGGSMESYEILVAQRDALLAQQFAQAHDGTRAALEAPPADLPSMEASARAAFETAKSQLAEIHPGRMDYTAKQAYVKTLEREWMILNERIRVGADEARLRQETSDAAERFKEQATQRAAAREWRDMTMRILRNEQEKVRRGVATDVDMEALERVTKQPPPQEYIDQFAPAFQAEVEGKALEAAKRSGEVFDEERAAAAKEAAGGAYPVSPTVTEHHKEVVARQQSESERLSSFLAPKQA